jgi:tetratricopeptide (TPR) repeat protein
MFQKEIYSKYAILMIVYLLVQAVPITAEITVDLAFVEEMTDEGRYAEAETLCKQLISEFAGTQGGLLAQEKLTALYAKAGKDADAEAAYGQLLDNYAAFDGLAKAVGRVGDAYREKGKDKTALKCHRHVVNTWPQADQAMKSQAAVIKLCLKRGDDPNAASAVAQLITDFSSHSDIAPTVDQVADEYREFKKYSKAKELYGHIVQNYSGSTKAVGSLGGMIRCCLLAGDDANALAAIDQLKDDFGSRDGAGEAVHEVAYMYHHKKKNHSKALELYQWIVTNHPTDRKAVRAQMGIAKILIEDGDDPGANTAVEKLIADYGSDEGIAKAVDHVADVYRKKRMYRSALGLYQTVVDRWPEAEHAIQSQASVARCYIALENEEKSIEALDKLKTDFAGNSELRKVLEDVADEYDKWGRYSDAKEVYKSIANIQDVDSLNGDLEAAKAAVIVHINDENDVDAFVGIDNLIADFNDRAKLADTLFDLAKKYYDIGRSYREAMVEDQNNTDAESKSQDFLRKTTKVTNKLITLIPDLDDDATVEAYHLAAECFRRLNEYAKAACYYQEVVNRSASFKYAGHAQFMVGYCYDYLRESGEVDEGAAKATTRNAYEKLLENYPNSPPVRAARTWLRQHKNSSNKVDNQLNEGVLPCGCE